MTRIRENDPRPWGLMSALLISAFVTLIGIVHGLEPMVILQRAAVVSIATGLVVSLVVGVAKPLLRKK